MIGGPRPDRDGGAYQCLASNPLGTALSQKADLRFACEFAGKAYNACDSENAVFLLYSF